MDVTNAKFAIAADGIRIREFIEFMDSRRDRDRIALSLSLLSYLQTLLQT